MGCADRSAKVKNPGLNPTINHVFFFHAQKSFQNLKLLKSDITVFLFWIHDQDIRLPEFALYYYSYCFSLVKASLYKTIVSVFLLIRKDLGVSLGPMISAKNIRDIINVSPDDKLPPFFISLRFFSRWRFGPFFSDRRWRRRTRTFAAETVERKKNCAVIFWA